MQAVPLFIFIAQTATEPQPPNPLLQLVPLLFLFIIFYFLLIRPQQKKAKEHQKLIESLKTGDRVVTTAGIHGLITNVKEKTVLIKVADNVKIEFDKQAVVSVQREENNPQSSEKNS
ncbi:MAG: preprotein translocase subunit YajC [Chthoniobacterales bacterium]|nr:preprotein translocase subunit YajC [Chthoniobacterales bacterium]MCX7713803.1 preprotein translocase subunit YajC [Chthoniobacterales bacterium]